MGLDQQKKSNVQSPMLNSGSKKEKWLTERQDETIMVDVLDNLEHADSLEYFDP